MLFWKLVLIIEVCLLVLVVYMFLFSDYHMTQDAISFWDGQISYFVMPLKYPGFFFLVLLFFFFNGYVA